MIIGFLSGGVIGLVAGIFFMSMCQAASGAEELTKKFENGYQGKHHALMNMDTGIFICAHHAHICF